jgi:hypothetical protein
MSRNIAGEVIRLINESKMTQSKFQKYINATTIVADNIIGNIITTRDWIPDAYNTEDDYYYEDGSTSEAGNEVVSSISKDDMENDDHFKMGTTYYKFVDFTS